MQACLDEMQSVLEGLGNRLDAAKDDEAVEIDAEVEQIDDLIWRYNDALESAQESWLRDDLGGEYISQLAQMRTPVSLGLPLCTDEQQ